MPSLYVASRNSRHRTACFALYKALIQQAVQVPLPNDVLRAPGLEGPVHPIKHLVRKSFRRNKNDTSPRLVISALRNGYKFLDMLSAAQDPSTAEYENIHTFLHERQQRKSAALAARSLRDPPPAKPSSAPNPNTIPLLTRVSGPEELTPRYEATIRPRPLSELGGTGIRRVPVLEKANFLPFLRLTKPQPTLVNRIILQKSKRMTKVVLALQSAVEEVVEAAEYEDQWEEIIENAIRRRPLTTQMWGKQKTGHYVAGVAQDTYDLRERLLKIRLDDHARGVALQKLVNEEKALAEKEKAERMKRKRKEKEARKRAAGDGGGDATAAPRSDEDIVAAIRGDVGEATDR